MPKPKGRERKKVDVPLSRESYAYLETLDIKDYNIELHKTFSYLSDLSGETFNNELDRYLKETRSEIDSKRLPPHKLVTVGKLCWIVNRGGVLREHHLQSLHHRLEELWNQYKPIKRFYSKKSEGATENRMISGSGEWLSRLDLLLDDKDFQSELSESLPENLSFGDIQEVIAVFSSYLHEFQSALRDCDALEAYGSVEIVQQHVGFCQRVLEFSAKTSSERFNPATGKPKRIVGVFDATKKQSDSQKITNFKYLNQHQDIRSVSPLKIIGKHQVAALNIKYGWVILIEGQSLNIQGSYVVAESGTQLRVIKIPSKVIDECAHVLYHCSSMKKIELYLGTLTTKVMEKSVVRFTKDTIILNAFKK